jgi:hypothetical protein
MKTQGGPSAGIGKKPARRARANLVPIPMEWMDPMSWRLPSGKALAEFALQAGFLAPLLLSGPMKRAKKAGLISAQLSQSAPGRRCAQGEGNTRNARGPFVS